MAVFSAAATAVDLCLFDRPDSRTESRRLPLTERTGAVWHGYRPEARPGQLYGFRVHGPWSPGDGHRCNPAKLLFDPYARAVGRPLVWHPSLFSTGDPPDPVDSAAWAPLGVVIDDTFDWQGDTRPEVAWPDTIIYELHVKGFTARHPGIPEAQRGTYAGLASDAAVAHLRALGVTAVKLMPIHARVDEHALHARGLTNYWGYNTLGFFAPEPRLAAAQRPDDVVREFKTMVRALHGAGIEVILDVVYNHTAEGDHLGPTLSMRGLDNASYYRLDPQDRRRYDDLTGCGNTLKVSSPSVLHLVMDSLRYWVQEVHVDGFRFDLASALARGPRGFDRTATFLQVIQQDPVLSQVKLIAEPWDATPEGYQVGQFPPGWTEWNGKYRDCVRRVWRGEAGRRAELATRLSGSSDLYATSGRRPFASLNFVTSHDGFTLADLVSYAHKHNEANGECNRDGDPHNLSANWGAEGPTDDAEIRARRACVQRSLLLTLLVSQGVPMINGGDELGRTQQGNNNAYCHDSPLTWTPWLPEHGADASMLAFAQRVVALRHAHPVLRRRAFLDGAHPDGVDVAWLGPSGEVLTEADWQDPEARVLGMWLHGDAIRERDARGERIISDSVLLLVNWGASDVAFQLPPPRASSWILDLTSAAADAGPVVLPPDVPYPLQAHAAVVLRDSGPHANRVEGDAP